jgi:hypothetical protein
VDEDGYTTVFTGGVAVFRTDRLYDALTSPDFGRPLLFIPIPDGFVRENIQVHGRADVTGVEYGFRDRQVPVNFPAGQVARASRIIAHHRQVLSTDIQGLLGGALDAYTAWVNFKAARAIGESPQQESPPAAGPLPRRPFVRQSPDRTSQIQNLPRQLP